MPTPTERFALDTYDPGESWDHTDTVQFLDEIAVARDTVANRPTSGTYDGEIFFATDEEIFYQWDATNTQWNEVLNAPTQAEFDSHSTRHERGGADEIPLNNLDLPAGAQIDEDGGDLVIRDSGGSIVLRRDEGAGTWDFVSGDLTGIASLEAAKADTRGGYSELSSSRALDTTETNNSGSDMNVSINLVPTSDGSFIRARLKVGGENVSRYKKICDLNEGGNVSAVVPDGSTYQLEAFGDTANYELQTWYEQT